MAAIVISRQIFLEKENKSESEIWWPTSGNTTQNYRNTTQSIHYWRNARVIHQSMVPIPLPGNHGAFALVISPGGGGIRNFIAARGDPEAFDTGVSERWMSLSGRMRPLSKTDLSVRD